MAVLGRGRRGHLKSVLLVDRRIPPWGDGTVLAHKDTGYHWNLLAINGRVIATSEHYNSKAAAMTGIRSVQKNGSTDVIVTDEELMAGRKPVKKASTKAAAEAKKAPAKAGGRRKSAPKA